MRPMAADAARSLSCPPPEVAADHPGLRSKAARPFRPASSGRCPASETQVRGLQRRDEGDPAPSDRMIEACAGSRAWPSPVSTGPRAPSTCAPGIRSPCARCESRTFASAGNLGPIASSGRAFDIEVRGACVCEEETAMLESLKVKRGIVRAKPPIPALSACSASPRSTTPSRLRNILARGAALYRDYGVAARTERCRSRSRATRRGGLVELAFGVMPRAAD